MPPVNALFGDLRRSRLDTRDSPHHLLRSRGAQRGAHGNRGGPLQAQGVRSPAFRLAELSIGPSLKVALAGRPAPACEGAHPPGSDKILVVTNRGVKHAGELAAGKFCRR